MVLSTLPEPPQELKPIRHFIMRGNQMARHDPVITYYCYFWATKQILANGLHHANQDCLAFTTKLMDQLEERKSALSDNDLITDNIAAQAYVENFAGKIFDKGFRDVEDRKATNATVEALQASSVFMETLKNFAEQLDQEHISKIRYAKYHAARIMRALKEGNDPNPQPTAPPPATVEEVVDESSTVQSSQATTSNPGEFDHSDHAVSPSSPKRPYIVRSISPDLPCPVREIPSAAEPPQNPSPIHGEAPHTYFPPVPIVNEPAPALSPNSMAPVNTSLPEIPQQHLPAPQYANEPAARLTARTIQAVGDLSAEDITKAQKAAKWAISALDYEDVPTAIKNFKEGLRLLGVEVE
ncbi:hypothetical protein RUND412_006208 [Rhizina undulata]